MTDWPDTTGQPPPVDFPHGTALWLLGRHPQLAALVDRIPDTVDEDGLSLQTVAEAVRDLDAWRAAQAEYERRHAAPADDAAYERWQAAGPARSLLADALACMSRTEQVRIRLLAFWASGPGVLLTPSMLTGFDDAGHRLIRDWLDAIAADTLPG